MFGSTILLEALKGWSMGKQQELLGNNIESIPFFKRALEAADLPRLLREWADSFKASQGRILRPPGQSLGKVSRSKRKTRINKGEDEN